MHLDVIMLREFTGQTDTLCTSKDKLRSLEVVKGCKSPTYRMVVWDQCLLRGEMIRCIRDVKEQTCSFLPDNIDEFDPDLVERFVFMFLLFVQEYMESFADLERCLPIDLFSRRGTKQPLWQLMRLRRTRNNKELRDRMRSWMRLAEA